MSVTEILEQVAKLSDEERAEVLATLRTVNPSDESEATAIARQDEVLQIMLRKGMIRSIPTRLKNPRKSRPIPIKGKPISETIIDDRR